MDEHKLARVYCIFVCFKNIPETKWDLLEIYKDEERAHLRCIHLSETCPSNSYMVESKVLF